MIRFCLSDASAVELQRLVGWGGGCGHKAGSHRYGHFLGFFFDVGSELCSFANFEL